MHIQLDERETDIFKTTSDVPIGFLEEQPLTLLFNLLFYHFNRSEPTYKSQRMKSFGIIATRNESNVNAVWKGHLIFEEISQIYRVSQKICYNPGNSTLLFHLSVLFFSGCLIRRVKPGFHKANRDLEQTDAAVERRRSHSNLYLI